MGISAWTTCASLVTPCSCALLRCLPVPGGLQLVDGRLGVLASEGAGWPWHAHVRLAQQPTRARVLPASTTCALTHPPLTAQPPRRQVTEEGRYIPPPPDNQKAAYATMVYVRATIVRDSGDFLSEEGSGAVGGGVGWVGGYGGVCVCRRAGACVVCVWGESLCWPACCPTPWCTSIPSVFPTKLPGLPSLRMHARTSSLTRPTLVSTASSAGRAVTIATRYAAVRRQTATKLGEPELQVGREGCDVLVRDEGLQW